MKKTSVIGMLFALAAPLLGADANVFAPVKVRTQAPDASAMVLSELARPSFRPSRAAFEAAQLELTVSASAARDSADRAPAAFTVAFKNKDGLFFQSAREFQVLPGESRRVAVSLDAGLRPFLPCGHEAEYERGRIAEAIAIGISAYRLRGREVELRVSDIHFTGRTAFAEPKVRNWRLPEKTSARTMFESTFELTREYFNPFDPAEIRVDYEITFPDGRVRRHPAFAARKFRSQLRNSREAVLPEGKLYWAFRFAPETPGRYGVRLLVEEPATGRRFRSEIRKFETVASAAPGFVGVSRKNPDYFATGDGRWYIPVGLNIHTNTDLRSEYCFRFGHLADLGLYDYEEYFAACGKAGINTIEIWMASWTFGIEWDAARKYYHGVGRYNLANAARLDRLLECARKNGLRINLVLDNHGKFTVSSDQEWDDNPYNIKSVFAASNGGFLNAARDFFTDGRAREAEFRRNRYLAARYGADPTVFAVEFWSEVDLVDGFQQLYENGGMETYHRRIAEHYRALAPGRQLLTTHVCGDAARVNRYRKLFDLEAFTHVAGDAYRNPQIHIADQLRKHRDTMFFPKPKLITEYGGTSRASDFAQVTADVHTGQWAAFFAGQAGTPFLWWHDFVHINRLYGHYRAAANYLRELRPEVAGMRYTDGSLEAFSHDPVPRRRPIPGGPTLTAVYAEHPMLKHFTFAGDLRYDAMCAGRSDRLYAYFFNRAPTQCYPAGGDDAFPPGIGLALKTPFDLAPGRYRMRQFSGATGGVVAEGVFELREKRPLLPLAPFRIDGALTLERMP